MGELTIEDKAKRYDEVIEELRGLLEGIHEDKCNIIEEDIIKIFPELKESEGERTRKAITEFFKNFSKNGTWKAIPDVTKWIAWLENKSESTDILADAVLGDNNDGLIADTIRYKKQTEQKNKNPMLSDFFKAEYERGKADAQKPTFVNNFRTWLYIVADVLTEFNGIGQYLDNSDCREIAERLREKYCFDDTSSDLEKVYQKGLNAGEIYGRNKAKKEQEQKPVKWSEEDKRNLNDAILFIKTGTYSLDKDNLINWLKFLKDRYTWEPSDEQMRVLDLAIRCGINRGTTEETTLVSLFNDLKKLREE